MGVVGAGRPGVDVWVDVGDPGTFTHGGAVTVLWVPAYAPLVGLRAVSCSGAGFPSGGSRPAALLAGAGVSIVILGPEIVEAIWRQGGARGRTPPRVAWWHILLAFVVIAACIFLRAGPDLLRASSD